MSRIVNLPTTENITVKAAETVTTDEVTLNYVVDNGLSVTCEVSFPNVTYANQYVLWDSTTTPTYEEIGVWTDEDVDNRLIEIL